MENLQLKDKLKIMQIEAKHKIFDIYHKIKPNIKNPEENRQKSLLIKYYKDKDNFFNVLDKEQEKYKYNGAEYLKYVIIYDFIYTYNIDIKNFDQNINKYEFKSVLQSKGINKEDIMKFLKIKNEILNKIKQENHFQNDIRI